MFVRLTDTHFAAISLPPSAADEAPTHFVRANYTVQILPTVLNDVFYELCALTLRTIFDLRIPGATLPIKSLLTLPGGTFNGPACPALNASGGRGETATTGCEARAALNARLFFLFLVCSYKHQPRLLMSSRRNSSSGRRQKRAARVR